MAAICPNCKAGVADNALACSKCGADFGEGSAWKPVVARHTAKSSSDLPLALRLGSALLSLAGWAVVLLGAVSRSLEQTGNLEMFRWGLTRSLTGFGPKMALAALLLGAAVAAISKGRAIPWVGILLGAGLLLFAQVGPR